MILSTISAFIGLVLIVPVAVLTTQIFAASFISSRRSKITFDEIGNKDRTVVIVPAHNEAVGIGLTLKSIKKAVNKNDRILVVADNCQDNTAEISRLAGVEVIERENVEHRGKGYALNYALRHLEKKSAPDVIVIIDADCIIEENTVAALKQECLKHGRPVQARYLMISSEKGKNPVSEFAFIIKNLVRPLGLQSLGWPCPLQGTGMAFPWKIIADANLSTPNIVEDLALGLEMVKSGHPPIFLSSTLVSSFFPTSTDGQLHQHQRWEQGYVSTMARAVPRLFYDAIRLRRISVFQAAIDLTIPPLVMLLASLGAYVVATALIAYFFKSFAGFYIAILSTLLMALAISIAWFNFGREALPPDQWMDLFSFARKKLALYGRLIFKRHRGWIRAERDEKDDL